MRIRYLGWAGIEVEADGATLVIDPLQDAGAVFAALGRPVPMPAVVPATPGAAAGLVTHLHLDHADAGALRAALAPGAEVLGPPARGEHRAVAPWESVTVGPYTVTALPAVDGIGDPQVSWLVEADRVRVLHLGDTMFHGHWWRIARRGPFDAVFVPVNGARVSFPHRQPASRYPAVLDPEQAAVACEILGAALAIPIHAEGYDVPGIYDPVPDAAARFAAASAVPVRVLAPGETARISTNAGSRVQRATAGWSAT